MLFTEKCQFQQKFVILNIILVDWILPGKIFSYCARNNLLLPFLIVLYQLQKNKQDEKYFIVFRTNQNIYDPIKITIPCIFID